MLGEVGFKVEKSFIGHVIYKGVIIKMLPSRDNNRLCFIDYENKGEEDIIIQ